MREGFEAGSTALGNLCWEVRAGRDSDLSVCPSARQPTGLPTSVSISILVSSRRASRSEAEPQEELGKGNSLYTAGRRGVAGCAGPSLCFKTSLGLWLRRSWLGTMKRERGWEWPRSQTPSFQKLGKGVWSRESGGRRGRETWGSQR